MHDDQQPAPAPVNGHGSAFRPDAAALIGKAVASALQETFPQMLFQALASVLTQVPVHAVTQQLRCAGCMLARLEWHAAYRAECEEAERQFAALPPGDPRQGQAGFLEFLPEHLRPGAGPRGMPPVADGVVMLNGSVWCTEHIPGAAGRTGRLLIA